MGHDDLIIRSNFARLTRQILRLEIVWAARTVQLALLQLLVDVLAVLANWVERFHQHAVRAYFRRRRCSRRLRQVDGEVGDDQWPSDVVR